MIDLEPAGEPRQLLQRPGPDEELREIVPGAAPGEGRYDREVPGRGRRLARGEGALIAAPHPLREAER